MNPPNGSVLSPETQMSIDRLEALNTQLDALESLVLLRDGATVLYDTGDEPVIGHGLMHEDGVAVQRAFCPAGSKFPDHTHPAIEHLIVYKGRMTVHMLGERHDVGKGDVVTIPPLTPHAIECHDETLLIGVTIPAEEGYPDVSG